MIKTSVVTAKTIQDGKESDLNTYIMLHSHNPAQQVLIIAFLPSLDFIPLVL